MAGSLSRFLCPSAALSLSSRDEVPAGVSGGECMAGAGELGPVPREERWPECPDCTLEAGEGEGAREGGSETGSKEKCSMRLAWQRLFCNVDERFRSSSSALGLKGPSRGSLPDSVRSAILCTAASGSISSLTSLKRTDWGCSCSVEAIVE